MKINKLVVSHKNVQLIMSNYHIGTVRRSVASMQAAGHSAQDVQRATRAYWQSVNPTA